VAQRLAIQPFASSIDSSRSAHETSASVGGRSALPITICDAFREIHFGDFDAAVRRHRDALSDEYHNVSAQLKSQFPRKAFLMPRPLLCASTRIHRSIAIIPAVAIVSHGAVNRILLAWVSVCRRSHFRIAHD